MQKSSRAPEKGAIASHTPVYRSPALTAAAASERDAHRLPTVADHAPSPSHPQPPYLQQPLVVLPLSRQLSRVLLPDGIQLASGGGPFADC